MIVIEGPDGSGKTSLLHNLLDEFPEIEEHARASASVGGPLPDIQDWAKNDLLTQLVQPLSFYDRHPIFSEPVYGKIIRNYVHPWFNTEEASGLGQMLIERSLIVICLPPIENVLKNVGVNDQMSGVVDHIVDIYHVYRSMLVGLAEVFPMNIFHYDYTVDTDYGQLASVVEAHQARWNRKGRIA